MEDREHRKTEPVEPVGPPRLAGFPTPCLLQRLNLSNPTAGAQCRRIKSHYPEHMLTGSLRLLQVPDRPALVPPLFSLSAEKQPIGCCCQ